MRIIIIIVLFLSSLFVVGQNHLPKHLYVQTQGFYGTPIIYSDSLGQTLEAPFFAGSFRIGVQTNGEIVQNQLLGFPKYGLGIFHTSLNEDTLGQPWAAYAFISLPAFRKGRFQLDFDLAFGLAWNFSEYDPNTNSKNDLIGSDLSAYFSLGALLSYKISDRLLLDGGLDFIHFSNGYLQTPNKGMNLRAGHVGLSYLFNLTKSKDFVYAKMERKKIVRIEKYNEIDFTINFGGKATNSEYGMGPKYPVGSFILNYFRRYNWIGKYGAGIDLMYDSSLREDYSTDVSNSKFLFVGITLAHELYISKFSIQSHIGTYLYKGTPAKGNFYFRIGMKYYYTKDLYLNLSLKTSNGFKADFIEFGMGYSLKFRK